MCSILYFCVSSKYLCFNNSSLLQQCAEANPETIEARFSTFKQKIESEMLGLLTKLSEQEKIITSSKQQLCKLRGENLNLNHAFPN